MNNAHQPSRWGAASLRTCLLVGLAWSVVASVHGQTKPFTTDQALFLQEVTTMLVEADKKDGRAFVEQVFAPAWNGTYLSERQRVRTVEVANFMLKKRYEPFPHFRDYLAAVAAFTTTGRPASEYDAWLNGLEQLAEKGRKQSFTAYLAMCSGLFKQGDLYSSASVTWRTTGKEFTFVFDTLPKVVFSKPMDLKCLAKGDSAVIRQTTGTYFPTQEIFHGKGGKITWERAGLKPQATYAEWDHAYEVRVKTAQVEVDTVRFTDPYFERTLIGKVTDKVLANQDATSASYPRFEGHDRRIRVKDIVEGVDFEGGFTLQGAKLQGYGTRDEPALLTFYRDKRPFILTRGLLYTIQPGRISSDDVGLTIRLDKDSITHHSVSLRFMRDTRQLTVIKKDEGLSKAPFTNGYHQVDMYCETISWKQGDPVVEFGSLPGSSQRKASFESFNYFKRSRYDAMMGIDAVHPLVRVRDYVKKYSGEFAAQDFAVFTKLQKSVVIPMLIDLANKGYLDYDPEFEIATVRPRLEEHVLASAAKRDYDVLQFNSNSEDNVNATLNLLNYDLALKGVARITVSDSQDVKIYPREKLVTLKKDRDFTFAGVVQAGRLSFHGKEYYFHYQPFVMDLLNVDSVAFMATSFEPNDRGEYNLVRVKNVLEQVTGTLDIDAPSNKSGIQQVQRDGKMQPRYPEYPRFNSTRDSYVFYDKKNIQRGAYLRDRFYYRSDPFQIDSLDNFTNAGLNFPGTLVSGGIFPDIREVLRLQPDYALGFTRQTAEAGLPLYGKKAKFGTEITLNGRGLQGNGDLAFLTTNARSKQFIFCPDSTIGKADTLYNSASSSTLKVPAVAASQVYVRFDPHAEELMAEKIRKPLVMYGGQAELHGRTNLTPKGMTGAGMADFSNATLASKLFQFETMMMHADTSDFRLTEGDTASIAFRTNNVNATIKFDERVGEFVSNGSETKVEFPVNQYICFMDRFKWYMDAGDISLESDRKTGAGADDLQLSGPNFISVRPDQDSLSFTAPRARYDLKRHLITADDVQAIQVADALVAPDSLRVRIRAQAAMDPLKNAVITANFVTRHHRIYNASVNIKSRRNYNATGDIDYLDENKLARKIHLDNVNVDTTFQTYAQGRILETDDFQLSPFFDFQGAVRLEANVRELKFTGSTRIQHGCEGLARNWMGFSGHIDPAEIFIPVADTLFDGSGARIGAGLYLTADDPFNVYGTFLSRMQDERDRPVIAAQGMLTFDKSKREYVIGPKDKIRQRNLPGDLVSLNTETCRMEADGRIRHAMDFGRVKADLYGTLEHKAREDNHPKAAVVMMTDFFFHENALERMAEQIMTYPEQKQVDITKTNYERSLRQVLGLERSDKLISELSLKGEIKRLPEELIKAITFCDLKMHWNARDEVWVSNGNLGIATILKKPLFRYVKGKVELQRKRSGDVLTILLMLDDQTWYFFQYTRNYLYAFSSDQQFNQMIGDLKEDKTKQESKKDEPPYQFVLTNKKKVNDFRDKYGL
ncbi:MAG: hypothetical protein JNM31_10155 [Flavobacteriales bacterium]|nr:hypothetical protein [Flavobacteriales bacterium]